MKNIDKKVNNIVHFIGIGGIGMSGIAELMLDQGFIIQGSDLHINENIKRLKKKGAKIFLGHRKSNIKDIKVAHIFFLNHQEIFYQFILKKISFQIYLVIIILKLIF